MQHHSDNQRLRTAIAAGPVGDPTSSCAFLVADARREFRCRVVSWTGEDLVVVAPEGPATGWVYALRPRAALTARWATPEAGFESAAVVLGPAVAGTIQLVLSEVREHRRRNARRLAAAWPVQLVPIDQLRCAPIDATTLDVSMTGVAIDDASNPVGTRVALSLGISPSRGVLAVAEVVRADPERQVSGLSLGLMTDPDRTRLVGALHELERERAGR